jgi:hypothetical protein
MDTFSNQNLVLRPLSTSKSFRLSEMPLAQKVFFPSVDIERLIHHKEMMIIDHFLSTYKRLLIVQRLFLQRLRKV